jgi:hypothetical protein
MHAHVDQLGHRLGCRLLARVELAEADLRLHFAASESGTGKNIYINVNLHFQGPSQ